MNNNFVSVNDIKEFTNLSHKQIRNNLNTLKNSSEFRDLIKGGGKGKGGQFWFNPILIPHITLRQRKKKENENKTKLRDRKLSEYFFSKVIWSYFGCIRPNRDIDLFQLVNSLDSFNSFYVIHRQREINHLHFTIHSSKQVEEIKDHLKSYFNKHSISIDKVFLTEFDYKFKGNTLNYLLRRGGHSSKRDLIDWGIS
jgi:hypothetical protein